MTNDDTIGQLRVGRLSCRLHGHKLTELRRDGEELVREIGCALRDQNWGTVPLRVTDVITRTTAAGEEIRMTAENSVGDLRLMQWTITLLLVADGIEYRVEGEYLAPQLVNRTGCYVLLPPATTVGREATLRHMDGRTSMVMFPASISPHQPMRDLRGLQWASRGDQRVTLALEGETFEMEDQRNWTDDSFKLYGTPLDLPFPVTVEPGDWVEQSVRLQVEDHFYPLPTLHTCAPLGVVGSSSLLEATRIDMLPGSAVPERMPDGSIHLALLLGADPVAELRRRLRDTGGWSVDYVSVATVADKMLDGKVLGELLPVLRDAFPGAGVGFGSAFYFTELNRGKAEEGGKAKEKAGYDFVYFGNAALVHAEDRRSIVQTAAGQGATVRSARALFPGLAVWVSPLTYYPRFNPNRTDGAAVSDYAHPPFRGQHEVFTAGWVLRCLLVLAEAGCATVEWFEDRGARGLVGENGVLSPAGVLLTRLRDLGAVGIRRQSGVDDTSETAVSVRFADGRQCRLSADHRSGADIIWYWK